MCKYNSLFTGLIFSGSVSQKFVEMVDLVSLKIGKATISIYAVISFQLQQNDLYWWRRMEWRCCTQDARRKSVVTCFLWSPNSQYSRACVSALMCCDVLCDFYASTLSRITICSLYCNVGFTVLWRSDCCLLKRYLMDWAWSSVDLCFEINFVAMKDYANCLNVLRKMCNFAIDHLLQSFGGKAYICLGILVLLCLV